MYSAISDVSDVSDLSSVPSSRLSSPEPASRYLTPSSSQDAEDLPSTRQDCPPPKKKRRRNPLPKERTTSTPTPGGVQPCKAGQKGEPLVVPVLLSTIEAISHIRIHLPKDIRQLQARETVWKSVLEVHRRHPDGITLLDPIQNMRIKDEKFKQLLKVSAYYRD